MEIGLKRDQRANAELLRLDNTFFEATQYESKADAHPFNSHDSTYYLGVSRGILKAVSLIYDVPFEYIREAYYLYYRDGKF